MERSLWFHGSLVLALAALGSCGGGGNSVNNMQQAQKAYLGLDLSVDKILNLGIQGYNNSTNANIPTETDTGGTMGTVSVTGQVDHGTSVNRSMHLVSTYTNYEDPVADPNNDAALLHIVYDTASGGGPTMDVMLMNVPNGTFTGSMSGAVTMSGDLTGTVTLSLSLTGSIEAVPGSTTMIQRVPNTTHITGTATSSYGTYNVDITR